MDILAKRLTERAEQLGISNAEAARRCGLDERRYHHYSGGRRDPDLETLVHIAKALGTTPNYLLGLDVDGKEPTKKGAMLDELLAAAKDLTTVELRIVVIQVEALSRHL